MYHRPSPPDVLVTGAGPVGLTTALALARQHIPVRIIDQATGPGTFSYGLALHSEVLTVFARLGVIEPILRYAYRIERAGIYVDGERVQTVEFERLGDEYPFIATIPQSALESILEDALAKEKVRVEWSHRLSQFEIGAEAIEGVIEELSEHMIGYATIHLEWMVDQSRKFRVPWLVGADGSRSRSRQLAHVPFEPLVPPQEFALFEFDTEHDLKNEMQIHFQAEGASVLWPLGERRCRWNFELPECSAHLPAREKEREFVQFRNEAFSTLPRSVLDTLLTERAPHFPLPKAPIEWRMRVQIEHRLAEEFHLGRVCLAGDAAHLTGPIGIQSMNAGLFEAVDLAETLTAILRDSQPGSLVAEWSHRARSRWEVLLGLRGGLKTEPDIDPRLAGIADRVLECLPAVGMDLPQMLAQLGFTLPVAIESPSGSATR